MKDKVIKDYMTFREIDCKNKDALTNYRRYITRFLEGCNETLSNLDEIYLTEYINKISNEFSQTTLNNIKPLIKNFIKWKFPDFSLKFRSLDKLCRTKRAKESYGADEMLTEEEVKKLIEGENDLFWKVFWLTFFYGGFRGIDVVRLKWDMYQFEKDGTTIIKAHIGKNDKTFYKCIPSSVTPLIKKWREVNLSEWVFPSIRGDYPIHPKSPNQRLSKLSKRVLGREINPYILRHSLASWKYPEGDEDVVANQMGHSKSMKERYTHLDDKALIKRAKKVWTTKEEMPEEKRVQLQKQIDSMRDDWKEAMKIIKSLKEEKDELRTMVDNYISKKSR